MWLDWNILDRILQEKKRVFFFGRSEDWVPKTLERVKKYINEIVIIDNNPTYKNTSFMGCKVVSPEILKKFDFNKDYVIVTAEPDTIIPELENNNLVEVKNFCCTPIIKEWGKLQELKKNSSDIIFSSSDYFDLGKAKSSKLGGGIFIANVANQEYEKKIDGQYRQVIKQKNHYYAVEYIKKEVHIFDNKFKIIQKYNLDQSKEQDEKPHYCGITYSPYKKCFFVANAASDEISIFEENNFKLLDKIIFSNKSKKFDDGQSHINDITSMDSSILVSYFSKAGFWKKGILDGGVAEIDIDTYKVNELVNNLSQPHSPEIINGQIYVLDSLNKSLYHGTKKISKFPGFVRGLSFVDNYFYIGQSEDMYLSNDDDIGFEKNTIVCNAGIYQLDVVKNFSRYLSVPDVMNIHDIQIYE